MNQDETKLWWLQELGLDVLDDSSVEWICVCPFCDDTKHHFYLQSERILFDCKKCSEQGSYLTLMSQLALNLAEEFSEEDLTRLAEDRALPAEAFADYDFGWSGTFYTLPVRDSDGNINNVLRYKLSDKLRSAPGCKMGLFGAQYLTDKSRKEEPVYIVEGPWDAFALDWLRRKAKKPGIVTAVLGAGHLPDEAIRFFKSRDVFVIQDNDAPGAKGEARIATKLTGSAKSLSFYRWNDDDTEGTDVRDVITGGL
jgi:hypothetical protein